MKKNFYLSMFAAVGMLLATSCSSDDSEPISSGNEAQVTFSVGLESSIGTRAISDGKSADKLVYAIYDENNQLITTIAGSTNGQFTKTGAFPGGGLKDNVTVSLAKGQTYTAVFWAQNSSCTAYNTSDLTNVTVDYSGVNNDETRDAFYAHTEQFTVEGDAQIDVTLKRPFAQINVGVTADDWAAAIASGITVETSTVEIKQAATTINLLTGKTGTPQDVTYSLSAIPTEILSADVDNDDVKESYHWLSMSYILVDDGSENGASKATLDGLKFTFHPNSGKDIVLADGLNNVPVQRNWRTNILGRILSGDVTFNITIDPNFDGEHNQTVSVSNAEELKEALSDPFVTTVTLEEDLNVNEKLLIQSEKEIDLNGKNMQAYIEVHTSEPFIVKNGNMASANGMTLRGLANADMTLDNVTLTNTNAIGNAIELGYNKDDVVDCGDAKLSIKNTTIDAECAGILIHGANNKVVIENSTINHKWFGITQNGLIPGSNITITNTNISGAYSGIYLSNNAIGAKNTLIVEGGSIHSDEESAIEVKKTDITVKNVALSSGATTQSYSVNGGGSNGIGYGIVLAGYKLGVPYEGTTSFENITYTLAAGDNATKILKYNGTEGEKVE